ncbi:MAG: hypothetical protein WA060_03545 [Minisyncoccia bacterium]
MKKEEIVFELKKAQKIINTCLDALESASGKILISNRVKKKGERSAVSNVDFSLNERNFIKTYAKGMSGPKKFTLLLAFMAKGRTNVDVEMSAISTKWSKMTGKDLLGYKFNLYYSVTAKTSGWVDSKKHGTYHLRNTWMNIFS